MMSPIINTQLAFKLQTHDNAIIEVPIAASTKNIHGNSNEKPIEK